MPRSATSIIRSRAHAHAHVHAWLRAAAAAALLLSCSQDRVPVTRAPDAPPRTWQVAQDGPRDFETIGQAIDAAHPGDIVRIGPGQWTERLVIDKTLTLLGAGARETVLVAQMPHGILADEEQTRLQTRLANAGTDDERAMLLNVALASKAVVLVTGDDVRLEAIGVRLDGRGDAGSIQRGAAVILKGDGARVVGCAIVGSPSSGIAIEGGDALIDGSLVAAIEATGIAVAPGSGRVEIRNCDVRDAIHRGITIGRDEVLVTGCRISGSSWHGIRYDGVGPTIRNNVITRNKRSGIYASGETSADVHDNLFLENGFNGLSAWYANRDTLLRNTFAYNGRSALEVLGASRPVLSGNVFAWSPTGVMFGNIGGNSSDGHPDARSDGAVELAGNAFFRCGVDALWSSSPDGPLVLTAADRGFLSIDPGFVAPQQRDFTLAEGSAGALRELGATGIPALASPWPRRPPELDAPAVVAALSAETPVPPQSPGENPYALSTPWVEAAKQTNDMAARDQALDTIRAAVRSDDATEIHAGLLAIARLSDQLEINWEPLGPRIRELCGTLNGEAMRRAFYALRLAGPTDADSALLLARMAEGQSSPEMSHLLMIYGDGDVSGDIGQQVLALLATTDADDLREVMRGLWGARVDDAVEARLLQISETRSEQDCIYFALSTLQDKSPAVIKRLFEAARSNNSEVFTRALWGLSHGVPEANAAQVTEGATRLLKERFVPEQRQLVIQRDAQRLLDVYGTR